MPRNKGDGIWLRGRTWWLDVQIDGKRYQRKLGKGISRTIAKEKAKVIRGEIVRGEYKPPKRESLTFEDASALFLEWVRTNKRPRTEGFYGQCLRKLANGFGGKRLAEIHPFHVEAYKTRRVKDGSSVRVNRELATLKALYNRLTKLKRYDGPNPVVGMSFLKESAGKLRFLDRDEEKRLLEACGEPLRTVVLVGIYTGLRVASELLTLRWESVDFRQRHVTVEAGYAKNGESRSVPLNSVLYEALLAHRALSQSVEPEAPVFVQWKGPKAGGRLRSIRTSLATACRKAKLFGVTPHTLRHTFASRLVMAGVDLRTVQELGGWKELAMVQRYSHLSPAHKAEAVERLIEQTTGEVAGESKKKSLRFSLHSADVSP